jgi:Response regulators consisting of a CheY-like receiver domain and a winged-helix DNA-binding domain
MRILLVEDTEDLAGALQKHLRTTGHTVDWAQNLHTARQFWVVEQAAYDVVVLDIELPDGSGLSLLHQIRQSERSVGVLMLTARADIEDKVRC